MLIYVYGKNDGEFDFVGKLSIPLAPNGLNYHQMNAHSLPCECKKK